LIEIKIKNEGMEAYRAADYGKSITICRQITKNGVTTWKVKNDKGKVVSDKKQEVDRIVSIFGMQVDNPVAILMQDTSRSFLSKPNPPKTYDLFMKATQLEQMFRDYEETDAHLKNLDAAVTRKEASLKDLEQYATKLEDEAEYLKEIEVKKVCILVGPLDVC